MTCYRLTATDLKNIRVRVDCGEEHTGLTHVLFHETSHIIDYVEHYTPYVEDNIRELGISVREKGFACKVWKKYAVPFA